MKINYATAVLALSCLLQLACASSTKTAADPACDKMMEAAAQDVASERDPASDRNCPPMNKTPARISPGSRRL